MKSLASPALPLLLVALVGALLLFFAIAVFLSGSVYAAGAVLLSLPVAAALATFRSPLSPLQVALCISAPTAVPAALIGNLAWVGFLAAAFVLSWLAGHFGRYRRHARRARRIDA